MARVTVPWKLHRTIEIKERLLPFLIPDEHWAPLIQMGIIRFQ